MIANLSLFSQMEAELVKRRGEILDFYKRVTWNYGDSASEGLDGDPDIEISFVFDPVDGEKYNDRDSNDSESSEADNGETSEDE